MLHKSTTWIGLATIWLATNAFTSQDQPAANSSNSWANLALLIVVIIIVAILLIVQRQKTPESLARYHLDHGTQGHGDEEHGVHAETVVSEEITNEVNEPIVEEAAGPEEDRPVYVPVGPPVPDDLTKIEGIGPKISEILHAAGIDRFDQLATTDVDQLHALLKDAGPRFALADPSHWPEQAGYLASGDTEKFQAFTDKLRGGRKMA